RVFFFEKNLCELCVLRGFFFLKELARWTDGAFGLPEGGAAVVAERVQRADVGERHQFVAAEAGAGDEIVDRAEARRAVARCPVVRAVVAEPLRRGIYLLEHRSIVTPTLRTDT